MRFVGMRCVTIAALFAAAMIGGAEAQTRQQPNSLQVNKKPADDQSWLPQGDVGSGRAPNYVREGMRQDAIGGGMAGSDDLFGNDVLPGGVGGPY